VPPIGARGSTGRWLSVSGLWLVLVLCGMVALERYASTPAARATGALRWPEASRIRRDLQRPELVLFAHPHCPCTRATVAELSRLMAALSGKLAAHLVFTRPAGVEPGWEQGALLTRARHVPGLSVELDDREREADLFGARTSGEAFLYNVRGELVFHGGITPARGHEGDSVGSGQIKALVNTGASDRGESAVFGCEL
jgi:hypothetical protein